MLLHSEVTLGVGKNSICYSPTTVKDEDVGEASKRLEQFQMLTELQPNPKLK